ncbi:MAG TPA: hypothetical protein VNF71_12125 [Acidimicrobiales bacterium]|nr:hypothetical protein [Acidimicrobiales bacterium]
MSPILDPQHDLAHPVEGDTAWSESYYFNCYDPDSDCGFFTRIGVRPNEGTIDVGLSVWAPGGGLAHIRHVVQTDRMVDSDLQVGPVRYRMIEAGKCWNLTAGGDSSAGPVRMDVTFDALTPLIGADGQNTAGGGASGDTRKMVGKGHLEQAGRWSGEISIDGRPVTLGSQTRGNRDKSWGPRRWGAPRMWRWFSVNIDDATHFGGIRIGTDSGDLHRGWAWVDGSLRSIKVWEVKTELEDDGVTHKRSHVVAVDKTGDLHELEGDMLRVEPGTRGIRPGGTVVNEGLARWKYRGKTGYGISEYLHQFDDRARPVVPIE